AHDLQAVGVGVHDGPAPVVVEVTEGIAEGFPQVFLREAHRVFAFEVLAIEGVALRPIGAEGVDRPLDGVLRQRPDATCLRRARKSSAARSLRRKASISTGSSTRSKR